MTSKDEKLAAIAEEVGVDVSTLRQYLHGELDSFKAQILLRGDKSDLINRALTANGEGVFLKIISSNKLPAMVGQGVSDYVGAIRAGIRERVSQSDYRTFYHVSNKFIADEEYFHDLLSEYRDTGIISIIPQSSENLAAVCSYLQMPCVLMDYDADILQDGIHTLTVDNYQGSFDAVRYLIDLGHHRIAYLAGILSFPSAQERLAGYREALANSGIPFDEDIIGEGDWTNEAGEAFMLHILEQSPRPTALVTANDLMALGALFGAKQQGVNIPGEISVIGCDDIPMVSSISPALTTLRQPMRQMGITAADIIVRILQGETIDSQHHALPLELVVRESTERNS